MTPTEDRTWCTVGGEDLDLAARFDAAIQSWLDVATCSVSLPTMTWIGPCEDPPTAHLTVGVDPSLEGAVAVSLYTGAEGAAWISDDVAWGSDANAADDPCTTVNLDVLLRHEVGHWLGLGHLCEGLTDCGDLEREAVMSPGRGSCDAQMPNDADRALLTATLGPVDPSHQGLVIGGPAPWDHCFQIPVTDPDVVTLTWEFGDGGTAAGAEVCHTFEEAGEFVVTVTVDHTCGDRSTYDLASVSVLPASSPNGAPTPPGGCAVVGSPTLALTLVAVFLTWRRTSP